MEEEEEIVNLREAGSTGQEASTVAAEKVLETYLKHIF